MMLYIISFFLNLLLSNRWILGFSEGAESWNGRLAMLAFMIIILIEFLYSFSILDLFDFLTL